MSPINVVQTVGIAAVLAAFIYIGKKLQVLDTLEKTTDKIKLNIKVISDHLTTTSGNFNPKELQSYSPLKLTNDGKKLIKDLGFDGIFEQHKSDFYRCIDLDQPKLKYDVETAAIKAIALLYEQKDYMSFLKVFFYNHPDRNIKNVAPTLGVYVRDTYLKEHPNISE